jgi:competence protein ComEC
MLFLSIYFLFLGYSASIFRAWISCMIGLGGGLGRRNSCALNTLGVALLTILLLDPLQIAHLGFQFSFLTTVSILLLYPCCDLVLQHILQKRSLSQMVDMDRMNQHGYCFLTFFRQGIALTLAVNLTAFPLMLYYFEKFPLLSLLYNLFFPFLITLSMLLLLLGGVTALFCTPLAECCHLFNQHFTHFVLNFTHNLPSKLDVTIRSQNVSFELFLGYLTLLLTGAIFYKMRAKDEKEYAI